MPNGNGLSSFTLGGLVSLGLWGLALAFLIVLVVYMHELMKHPACKQVDPKKREFVYAIAWVELALMALGFLLTVGATVWAGMSKVKF